MTNSFDILQLCLRSKMIPRSTRYHTLEAAQEVYKRLTEAGYTACIDEIHYIVDVAIPETEYKSRLPLPCDRLMTTEK